MTNELIVLEVDGKTYFYNGKYFFDEFFILLEGAELHKVSESYFKDISYETLKAKELIAFVKELKDKELYVKAKKVMEYGMEKYSRDENFYYHILPIYTSCCRKMGCPQEAIEKARKCFYKAELSPMLCTSLAAAYCDIKDYEKAKKYALMAYAKQGGGQGYKNELSLLFLRLRKETGETLFEEDEQ